MGKRSSHVTSVIRFAAPDHPACNAIDQSEVARPAASANKAIAAGSVRKARANADCWRRSSIII